MRRDYYTGYTGGTLWLAHLLFSVPSNLSKGERYTGGIQVVHKWVYRCIQVGCFLFRKGIQVAYRFYFSHRV